MPIRSAAQELCPITHLEIVHPVQVTCCKKFFEGEAIRRWVLLHPSCPVCRKELNEANFLEASFLERLQRLLLQFLNKNRWLFIAALPYLLRNRKISQILLRLQGRKRFFQMHKLFLIASNASIYAALNSLQERLSYNHSFLKLSLGFFKALPLFLLFKHAEYFYGGDCFDSFCSEEDLLMNPLIKSLIFISI